MMGPNLTAAPIRCNFSYSQDLLTMQGGANLPTNDTEQEKTCSVCCA